MNVRIMKRPDEDSEAGRYHNKYLAGQEGELVNVCNDESTIDLGDRKVWVPSEYVCES